MNRAEKVQAVESLKEKFANANAAFVTEYRGMTVEAMTALRSKVREGQGEVKVVKNRLAKIAVRGSKYEGLVDELKGPVALAFSYKDAVGVAKALTESVSKESPFNIRLGNLEGKMITDKEIEALSKLPDRETLLSMLASALQGPIRNFAQVMAAVPRDFAGVMNAVKTEKEKQG